MVQRLSLRQLVVAVIVLVALARLPAIAYPGAINDESYYSIVANEMLHGGLPYQDAVDRKPPLLYVVYWGIYRLTSFSNWPALHVVALGWTLATMGLLFGLGRRLFTPLAGVVAALLYGVFQPFLTIGNLAFNGEMLMNLPAVAALALPLRPGGIPTGRAMAGAGALVAIACLLKQPAGAVLLPLVVYALHPSFTSRPGYRRGRRWWHAAAVGGGFALVLGVAALLLHQRGILSQAWYWSVADHDVPHGPLDPAFWRAAFRNGAWFALFCGPLLVGGWLSLRTRPGHWQGLEAERDALVAFLVASLIGTAASGRFFSHYFLQLMPPLALLAAPTLADLWSSVDQGTRMLRRLTLGWTALSALTSLCIETVDALFLPPPARPAIAWLQSQARPGDRIFVWGQDPHIYLATGTRPASRYFASFPLTGYIYGAPESWDPHFDTSDRIAPGAWDSLPLDFARHAPRYIVDTDGARSIPRYPMARFPYLAQLVDTGYQVEFRGSDALVYGRRP